MNKQYHQLTQELRYQISASRKTGMTLRQIAEQVGVHFSTVCRELKRNVTSLNYDPKIAHTLSCKRRRMSKKACKRQPSTDEIIRKCMVLNWSPGAISDRMPIEFAPSECLSHTTIYRRIEENKQQGGTLYQQLPRYGKTRWKGGKRKRNAGVSLIPDRVDISERPKIVEARERIGDWEGDTVHGQNAHLVTLVDRCSRFTLARRVFRKTKEEVSDAMIALLGQVDTALTITLDNGGEFAGHMKVHEATRAKVYFAKPYASWQRGTNENTNGRIRRFWPKKFDMAMLTEEEIENRILQLNLTPRKILGGLTPLEVFTGKRVALIA